MSICLILQNTEYVGNRPWVRLNEIEFSSVLSAASAVHSIERENPREASVIQKNDFRRVTKIGPVPSCESIDPQNRSDTQGVQNIRLIRDFFDQFKIKHSLIKLPRNR